MNECDVIKLASILASRIIKNHAYIDGNKRTALLAADAFLKTHGKALQPIPLGPTDSATNVRLTDAHVAVATNQYDESQLAEVYRELVRDFAEPMLNNWGIEDKDTKGKP